jgi:hypothetical protein
MAPIIACAASILLTSCGDDGLKSEIASGEHQLIELEHRLKLLEYRAGQTDFASGGELGTITGNLTELADRERHLVALRADLLETTAQLENQLADTKTRAARALQEQRDRAIGREIDPLVVRDGRSFAKVRVVSVDDGGVSIRHENGAARLRHADLTVAQQMEFGMDSLLAAAAERKERAENAAYEQWLNAETARVESEESRKAPELPRTLAASGATSRRLGDTSATARTSLLSQPARTFGSGSIYRYSSYRSYQPTYRHVHYYQPYCPSYQRSYRPSSHKVIRPPSSRQYP